MLFWRKHWLKDVTVGTRRVQGTARPRRSVWEHTGWASLIVSVALFSGCKATTGEPDLKYFGGDRDLQYYRDVATQVEYSDVGQECSPEVAQSLEPRRLRHPTKDQIWDVSLDEAVRTTLMNSEVIRDNASFLNPGNRLLNSPDFAQSVYDVAIQETNTLFGQGGVEAALSEFDATLTTNLTWGRSEQVADSNTIGYTAFDTQTEEYADFRSTLSKLFANGSGFALSHNWFYSGQNQEGIGARPFPSEFTSRPGRGQDLGLPTVAAEFRAPLMAGAGTEYTRVAGPVARRPTLASTPTVNQGVVIARIRTDISIADFEESVSNLIRDVEDTYWELALAYRTYDAETMSRNSALQTWREVRTNMEAGKIGAADEAQARDNFYEIRARAENALAGLYSAELRLRRLMGLGVNDGRVMRPVDEPVTAEIMPDWNMSLTEALTFRPELRKQKWNIKSIELQYEAAQNLVRPRLDFVARYEINGFGDRLFGHNNAGQPFHSAYHSLLQGDQTGWGLGFEFSMPLGFRGAHAQVKNYEHRLAKSRAILATQEVEISHELANALQQLDQTFTTAKTNFNRRRAAERRLQAFEAEYKVGRTTLDMLLRSQISLAQAEVAYFQSLIGYNRALTELKFRKGTILNESQVYLQEGLWSPEAYDQALRKAWARSFAFDAPHKDTAPEEFVLEYEDCQLTTQPAAWGGPAEPLSAPYDTPVPAPEAPPADSAPTQPPKADGRSASNDIEGIGSLSDDGQGDFVPPIRDFLPPQPSEGSAELTDPMPEPSADEFEAPILPQAASDEEPLPFAEPIQDTTAIPENTSALPQLSDDPFSGGAAPTRAGDFIPPLPSEESSTDSGEVGEPLSEVPATQQPFSNGSSVARRPGLNQSRRELLDSVRGSVVKPDSAGGARSPIEQASARGVSPDGVERATHQQAAKSPAARKPEKQAEEPADKSNRSSRFGRFWVREK